VQKPDFAKSVRTILNFTAKERLQEIGAQLANITKRTVQSGPFKDMLLPLDSSWGEGDLVPKLLGAYEAELHPAIERAIARQPDVVINVGCAEGFYAVGLARRLPHAHVHAFDISEAAQKVCAGAGAENGVGDRLTVHGRCEAQDLVRLVGDAKRALLVIDCEGFELDLLTPDAVAAMGHCDLVVECHDFMNRTITPTLKARFEPTHEVAMVREGPRDPSAFPQLRNLNDLDRWLCVCEFRPEMMYWMAAYGGEPRA
jgi:hypothetical protein